MWKKFIKFLEMIFGITASSGSGTGGTPPPIEIFNAPTLSGELSGTQVNLTYTNDPSNTLSSNSYEIWRNVNGGVFTLLDTETTTSYSDTTITEGNAYEYRVRAYNTTETQYTAYSNTVGITYNPTLGESFEADYTDKSDTSIIIEWQ